MSYTTGTVVSIRLDLDQGFVNEKQKARKTHLEFVDRVAEILHFFFPSTILDANTVKKNNADSVIGWSDALTKVALFLQATEPAPSPFSLRKKRSQKV